MLCLQSMVACTKKGTGSWASLTLDIGIRLSLANYFQNKSFPTSGLLSKNVFPLKKMRLTDFKLSLFCPQIGARWAMIYAIDDTTVALHLNF